MGAYLRTDTSTHMLCNLFPVLAVKTNCYYRVKTNKNEDLKYINAIDPHMNYTEQA